MTDKPVVIRRKDGGEVVVRTVADAKRVYPDAKILRYENGDPYHEPKADKSDKKDDA